MENSDTAEQAGPSVLRSEAWIVPHTYLGGVFSWIAKHGTLELAGGKVTFTRDNGQQLFSVPLAEIGGVRFPAFNAGAAMSFTAEGKRRHVSFINPGARTLSVGDARQEAQAWKTVFGAR